MKTISIDFQKDFSSQGGKHFKTRKSVEFVKKTLIPYFRQHNIKVAEIISDYRLPRPTDPDNSCRAGEWGYESEITEDIKLKPVWIKCMNSPVWIRENIGNPNKKPGLPYQDPAFFTKWLEETIGKPRSSEEVVLIGLTVDCCVFCTAQELSFRGYNVRILEEGVATYSGSEKEKNQILNNFPLKNWAQPISWKEFQNKYEKSLQIRHGKIYKEAIDSNINMNPGNPLGLPDESFFQSTIIFIDEAFLSKLSKFLGKGKYIKFDRSIFARNIAKKQKLNCEYIFLYVAPPFQDTIPSKEQIMKKEGYDKFVYKLKQRGIEVKEGRCQRLKIDGKFEYRQKGVDILLAMDLMSVPLNFPKIKKIVLIASDSDFVPVINNLDDNGIKTILYTYYEKGRSAEFSTSNELIKSVNKYVLLTNEDFTNAIMVKEGV